MADEWVAREDVGHLIARPLRPDRAVEAEGHAKRFKLTGARWRS